MRHREMPLAPPQGHFHLSMTRDPEEGPDEKSPQGDASVPTHPNTSPAPTIRKNIIRTENHITYRLTTSNRCFPDSFLTRTRAPTRRLAAHNAR